MSIKKDIERYCKINNISDVDAFIDDCLIKGFNIVKYGLTPKENFDIENGRFTDKLPLQHTQTRENECRTSNDKPERVEVLPMEHVVESTKGSIIEEKPKRKTTKKIKIIKK